MEVRKSDGSFEEFDRRKLGNVIRKAFKTAEAECTSDQVKEIIDSLYIYDGILCSSIRKQLENRFKKINEKVLIAYKTTKQKKDEIKHFVEGKKEFIDRYKKSSNTANATIDDNSNVGSRNVAVINSEIHKPDNIQISRGMITDKLKELFPTFNAKNYVKDLEHHIIYKNDESSFAGAISPYCTSITMYPFLTNGLKGIGGLSARPHNIDSFCGMYCNLVFAISSQFAGAVATSEVLLCMTWFAKKEWGENFWKDADTFCKIGPKLRDLFNRTHYWTKNVKELAEHDFGTDELNKLRDEIVGESKKPLTKEELQDYVEHIKDDPTYIPKRTVDGSRTILGQLQQYWQQIVYTINQPAAARGFQSAFVNFSYFDKPFFDGMFGDFYFPDGTQPDWESLKWMQQQFMVFMNEERLRTILTFPVESATLLYKDGEFQDKEMFDFVCEEYARGHSFFTYISDSVDSLSSCCFSGDEKISYLVHDNNCQPEGVFSKHNVRIEDAYDEDHDNLISILSPNPKNIEDVSYRKGRLIKTETNSWVVINGIKMTPDHILPIVRDNNLIDAQTRHINVGDKLIYFKNGKIEEAEVRTKELILCESPEPCYCVEVVSNPYFVLDNNLITHNCRLKNKIQTKEFNFTNGNIGVQTGSKSVISFNLSRIIQDWYCSEYKTEKGKKPEGKFDESKYPSLKKYMAKITSRVYMYHAAYNELLWDMYDSDLLPVYKAGFIDLNKQYLTLGLNGLNQAAEFLGMTCNDNPEYSRFCQEIFGFFKEQNEAHKVTEGKHKLTFNTEQVPAESLAIKNYNWDREDGYWTPSDTNLYASYVYKPNDASLSVLEKLKMMGSDYVGDWLDGGSAAHINLDSHLSKEQYAKLIKYAAEVGCSYLCWNIPNCECDDCGFIAKQPFDICPRCGSKHVSLYDRVIGYLTKIKNWSAGRQIEQKTRVYDSDIKNKL